MNREVKLSKEKIKAGIEKSAAAVGSTLGPKGRPVLIEREKGMPYFTKDGVTVAKHIHLIDGEENLGAKTVLQAAQSTVQVAGDGTTTSTVLANAIIQDADEDLEFIQGIEQAAKDAVALLDEETNEMNDEMIKHISYISTNSDKELSDIVTKAFIDSGEDGIVDVKYAPSDKEVSLDIKTGSYITAGFSHDHFVTDPRQGICQLDKPFVLVSKATLNEMIQIEHLLNEPVAMGRPVLIIADTEKNFNEAFVTNVAAGNIKGAIINPGHLSSAQVKDLAALLKAIYFDNAGGNSFDYLSNNYWGYADQAIIGRNFTLFSLSDNSHVEKNIKALRELVEENPDDEGYKTRLAMLNGKFATIKVGAPTQAEAMEIKDRVDDAVMAVGAAQKFGYLPGGGVALRDISIALTNDFQGDEDTPYGKGYFFLLACLNAPYAKILENAGIKPVCHDKGVGINALNGEKVDMIEKGIIDPALVTKQAVVNAVSVSTTLLASNAMLILSEDESN